MRVVPNAVSECSAAAWLERVGIAAVVFTGLVVLLLFGNFFSLRRTDPIHSPALTRLALQLKAEPQNESLKQQIRDLDFLARRAFFSSQSFQRTATFLILVGALSTILSFKSLAAYRQRSASPPANSGKDDLAYNAQWARRAVSTTGLVLAGLALGLSLPFESELDKYLSANKDIQKGQPSQAKSEDFLRNWPGFLGAASGHALSIDLPVDWDGNTGKGIIWKATIPKAGLSSPVVWGERIFLTGGDADQREIYCYRLEDGAMLWKHEARGIPNSPSAAPKIVEETTYAAPTMACDGSRAFAIFATGDLVAVDLKGKRLWARNLGVPKNLYGHSSSLALAEDTLIVQLDAEKGGTLHGIDPATGADRWTTPRTCQASWASPVVVEISGVRQVLTAATPFLAAYSIGTGAELWKIDCFDKRAEVAPSPVWANGLIYVAAESAGLMAIDPTKRSVAWKIDEAVPSVCTPLVHGNLIFYGLNEGGLQCRNALNGSAVWEAETDAGIYASPLIAGDRIYFMDRTGVTYVVRAAPKFELIARCALGEEASTTPAAQGGSLFIRGSKHLFRIGS